MPGIDEKKSSLKTFTNGFIEFKSEDEEYDEKKQYEMNNIIIDMTGKTLLQTTALAIYENMYLVKNDNKKMVLMDKDLKIISDEYDKIITNITIDNLANYSSYY